MVNTILGFDYGSQRIGVAVGQTLTATARPVATLTARNHQPDWQQLTALIAEWQPHLLVVGLPTHADGSASETTLAAQHFITQLQTRYQLPIETIDERLSSVAAEARLQEAGVNPSKKAHKRNWQSIDAVAAQIILETWFAEQNSHR